MSISKKLLERLVRHPQLEKRVSDLLDVIEAESGSLDRADEAEEAVITHLGEMGNGVPQHAIWTLKELTS